MNFARLRTGVIVVSSLCLATLASATQEQSAAPVTVSVEEDYEFGVLHNAPGVEETFYACTACHSEMIVAQQGLSREDWDELFVWMVEEQGMAEIDEPDRSLILDYLAKHYNEDRPNLPGTSTN